MSENKEDNGEPRDDEPIAMDEEVGHVIAPCHFVHHVCFHTHQEGDDGFSSDTPAPESAPMTMDSEEEDAENDTDAGPYHKNYVTTRYMTKYEKARILGTRALQIRFRKKIFVHAPITHYKLPHTHTTSRCSEQHGRTSHGRPRRGNRPFENR